MLLGVYHGCHNTFVICDHLEGDLSCQAITLCQKYRTDGLLTLGQGKDLEMVFYNADGSRAPMCGNGIRCFTRFLYEIGLITTDVVKIRTLGGIMTTGITSLNPFMVKVNLGKPNFSSKILDINTLKEKYINETIKVDERDVVVSCVFLGTHHAVIFVDEIKETLLGEAICHYPLFTKQINVNFVKVIDRKNIFVKTYERGVGWTQACGTGANSSYVISKLFNLVDNVVTCHFAGGEINVWTEDEMIIMEGPAEVIKEISNES